MRRTTVQNASPSHYTFPTAQNRRPAHYRDGPHYNAGPPTTVMTPPTTMLALPTTGLAPPTLTGAEGPLGSSVVTVIGKLAAAGPAERRTFSRYCFSSATAMFHSLTLEPVRLGGVGRTPVNGCMDEHGTMPLGGKGGEEEGQQMAAAQGAVGASDWLPVVCSKESNITLLRPTINELGRPGGIAVDFGQYHWVWGVLQSV